MITKDEKNNIFKEIFAFIDSEKFKLDFTHINSMERFAIKKSDIKNTNELLTQFYSYSNLKIIIHFLVRKVTMCFIQLI